MAWPGPLTWLHAYPPAHRGHITGPVLQMGKLKLGVGGVQGLAAGVVKSSNLGAKRALDFGHPPWPDLSERTPPPGPPGPGSRAGTQAAPFLQREARRAPCSSQLGNSLHTPPAGTGQPSFPLPPPATPGLCPARAPSCPRRAWAPSSLLLPPLYPKLPPTPTQWGTTSSPHPDYWGRMPAQPPLAPGSCSQPWQVAGLGQTPPCHGQV